MKASRFIPLLALGVAACSSPPAQPHAQATALACTADSDCPGDGAGAWSTCTVAGPDGSNATSGLQARSLLVFACEQGQCQPRPSIEMRACTLDLGPPCKTESAAGAGVPGTGAPAAGVGAGAPGVAPARLAAASQPARHVSPASRIMTAASASARPAACAEAGTPCSTGNACEQGEIRCIDGGPRCVAVSMAAAGTVCRPASGPCDLEERCDGISGVCPADGFAGPASVCRSAAGPCDRDETCTGMGPACPLDAYLANGTECRTGAGECDATEVCTGSSAMCPADDAGCQDGGYCLVDTCHVQPSISVQGNDGGTCSDLGRTGQPQLRITFRGRPHAPFRYWRRHLSCAGAAFEEQAAVACDEGTVGQLDATGTCTYTVRGRAAGATCPDPRVGRWELAVEVDGHRSASAFIDFHDSTASCAGNPSTCTAAATYCPTASATSALASQRNPLPEDWQ